MPRKKEMFKIPPILNRGRLAKYYKNIEILIEIKKYLRKILLVKLQFLPKDMQRNLIPFKKGFS